MVGGFLCRWSCFLTSFLHGMPWNIPWFKSHDSTVYRGTPNLKAVPESWENAGIY
jgi:hypothetical protein